MSEWSNEHDWKSCDVKASAGSNPVLCARYIIYFKDLNLQVHSCRSRTATCCSRFVLKYANCGIFSYAVALFSAPCRYSLVVKRMLPKHQLRVRFPLFAPRKNRKSTSYFFILYTSLFSLVEDASVVFSTTTSSVFSSAI